MRVFAVLTLQITTSSGTEFATLDGTLTVSAGATREQVYRDLKSRAPDRYRDSAVVFFTVEPNLLVPRPAGVEPLPGGDR